MTLIAFACYGDHAEFITDSASYTRRVNRLGTCTKHVTINHLDAAVLTQGNALWGTTLKNAAYQLSGDLATFDELLDTAEELTRAVWQECANEDTTDSVAFFIGYSERRGKFIAKAFASDRDFKPFEVSSLFVHPSPWALRPSDLELERFKRWHADRDDLRDLVNTWRGRKPPTKPRTMEEWLWLAMEVRASRALDSFAHVIVAGHVTHTRLERGAVVSVRIHEYDDSGEEFQKLIAWTQHPQAQAAECHCGSGERYADCHLLDQEGDQPCGCGSTREFGRCCMVADAISGCPVVETHDVLASG